MKIENLIIIGSSGHSKVIIDIFEKTGKFNILGLIDPFRQIGDETLGYKILGNEESLAHIISSKIKFKLFIAIGDNHNRYKVMCKLANIIPNIDYVSAIHPSAQIGKNVKLGIGVAVMAGAVINSDTVIEDFTIINTKASIDHDCKMEKFSSLAPNVTIGGYVKIGEFSAISISAIIKDYITVGKHSVIGAGAFLNKNCGDCLIFYGIPAKEIRKRQIGEKYF